MAELVPIRTDLEAERRETVSAVRRDPRLDWSAEQTLLAWVRTGVAIMAFGFVIARSVAIFHLATTTADHLVTAAGVGLMLIGCAVSGAASWRYFQNHTHIARGDRIKIGPGAPIVVALSTAIVGLFLVLAVSI